MLTKSGKVEPWRVGLILTEILTSNPGSSATDGAYRSSLSRMERFVVRLPQAVTSGRQRSMYSG